MDIGGTESRGDDSGELARPQLRATATPRPGTAADVPAVAALHADCIAQGFLSTLPPRFLRRLYRRIVRSPGSFLLVSGAADAPAGFVAVSEQTGRLYREFLRHDGLAVLGAAPVILRAPRRVWETLRYGFRGDDSDLPPAEILAIAVAREAQGAGVGNRLLDAALDELRRRGIDAVRVVTSAGNEPALRMYQRAGFRRQGPIQVHDGVPQEVLVWR